MVESALFIGWGNTYPGREHDAVKLFEETIEVFRELEAAKEIDSFESVMLGPHGGELDGFFLVRGELDKLFQLMLRPELDRMRLRAMAHHAKFSVIPVMLGEAAHRQIVAFDEIVTEIEQKLVTV